MTYPIIVCEDDKTQLKNITVMLENYIMFHDEPLIMELSAETPNQVITHLINKKISRGIYFLDIDLGTKIDGIELAKKIRKIDVQANIIFTTTHDEMAPITLKNRVGAIDFIDKDVELTTYRDNIYSALKYAENITNRSMIQESTNFTFEIGNQMFNFDKSEIILIETSQIPHRLNLETINGNYEFYDKIANLEKKYPFLLRLNRSCLINPLNIRKADFPSRKITFKNESTYKFPLGKSRKIKSSIRSALYHGA
ncbi:DNA-binding response regulator [Companilactobacillus sp. HBUAS56275]|uniref:response regulator n=1 Tax=Companilactobacillus sp. HBUAS56275 TaxID=3109364 RepID=UPI002FF2F221